jgi:hypothetical protein
MDSSLLRNDPEEIDNDGIACIKDPNNSIVFRDILYLSTISGTNIL